MPMRSRGTCCTRRATAARRSRSSSTACRMTPSTRCPATCARCSPSAGSARRRCSWWRSPRRATACCPRTRSRPSPAGPAPGAPAPGRGWLDALAADAEGRGDLVRRTLAGALDSIPPRVRVVQAALDEQLEAAAVLRDDAAHAYAAALDEVDETVRSGSLLRGEVLARWHEVVGTGDFMRALESRVGWLRDRVRSLVTGAPAGDAELKAAVGTGVDAVVAAAPARAAERAAGSWRGHPAGRALLEGQARMDAASSELPARTEATVRAWQGHVFELVREKGAGKRTTARLASLGVNGGGLTVMLAVFAQTGGLTGAEIAVAGGTSAVGQRVLEAVFGDQAVRALAARARAALLVRVRALLDEEAARFERRLAPVAPDAAE